MTDIGSFELTGVGGLPNVNIAFPGEHWSDGKASGAITPGVAVVPTSSAGKRYWKVAGASDSGLQLALAMRTVDVPDPGTGPRTLGPNEVRNTDIASGDYVHAYYSGAFHLTLVTPTTYSEGDLIGWDADGVRPAGKSGAGTWAKNAAADIDSVFEVILWRPVNASNEGVLTVRSLRGQF